MKMFHHHRCFFGDYIRITFHESAQFLLCTLFIKHRIILDLFGNLIPAVNSSIILQDIQNKTFLNCLFHSVDMERPMFYFSIFFIRCTKQFFCFIFRCCGKSKVAGIFYKLTTFHNRVNLIFVIKLTIRSQSGECKVHISGVTSALPGMSFINNNRKFITHMLLPNFLRTIWEFFYCSNDDALTISNSIFQLARMACPSYSTINLYKLLNSVLNLLIQNSSVSNNQNRIYHRMTVFFKAYELMCKPGNGI